MTAVRLGSARGRKQKPTLQWTDRQFQTLLESLPAGAFTCDSDGLITSYNRRAVEFWGREPKLNDPMDRFCGSFKMFSSDGSPIRHDQCWMALALLNDKAYNGCEIIVERPDGQLLTGLAHANPIHDDSGKLVGAMNFLVDITDRKRAEAHEREADRSKDEFLATLSHELRNPLAPIRNAVRILQLKTSLSPESSWALEVVNRQMQQMTRLIDDLLDVSRITRNKFELRKATVELAEVVLVALETSRPLLEAAGHDLTVTVPPPPPIYLDADLTRLAQVLSNLLNNAAKYTEPGGRIWLTAERQGSDAVFRVRDTGIGIPPEMLTHIFDMFTKVDRSPERVQGGLGIGLTLVKRLVEMHGGTVEARSEGRGQGSEFIIRLPIVIEEFCPPNRLKKEAGPEGPTSSFRILLVEDNQDSAATLGLLLRLMGNDLRFAHDGFQAVNEASEFRPEVILLDIGLPRMDGYEVARAIRQKPWGRSVVLIAITGWGQEGDRLRSREAGFDHHLVKPVDPAGLMELLASLHVVAPGRSAGEPAPSA